MAQNDSTAGVSPAPASPEQMQETRRRDQAHLVHSLHQKGWQDTAHCWVRGEGALLYDDDGKEYLDALAGLWNVIAGHGQQAIAQAAYDQMCVLPYATSYAGSTNLPAIELGEKLAAMTYRSINRFFFTSGGGESNEAAFKTARFYWKRHGKPDKYKIVGRVHGYHGTTLAAMAATGMPHYWPMFGPLPDGFLHIPSPYPYRYEPSQPPADGDTRTAGQMAADELEAAILREGADTVAAFIGEPVQAAGGVIVPPDDYWPRIREICDRHDVLLIADEVVTGFGRTGYPFALMAYDVEPDMISFAKGITSGYFPLGGVGLSDAIVAEIDAASGPETWMHAYTYSGHPTGCAVALANLDLLESEGLYQRAIELGEQLRGGLAPLASHPHVGDVRGRGLMAAVELVADKSTKAPFPADQQVIQRVHEATQRRGMFTRISPNIYNIAPCYATEPAQIERMVNILGESIEDILG
ncbi:MAG: aspartate aminotransferase family protein [Planctomycetales bacterium]|nr:aspartate aminotransferase family protein [Planctomycetales bacterium]